MVASVSAALVMFPATLPEDEDPEDALPDDEDALPDDEDALPDDEDAVLEVDEDPDADAVEEVDDAVVSPALSVDVCDAVSQAATKKATAKSAIRRCNMIITPPRAFASLISMPSTPVPRDPPPRAFELQA